MFLVIKVGSAVHYFHRDSIAHLTISDDNRPGSEGKNLKDVRILFKDRKRSVLSKSSFNEETYHTLREFEARGMTAQQAEEIALQISFWS